MKTKSMLIIIISTIIFMTQCASGEDASPASSELGKAGSMARFSIVNNHLYAIAYSQVRIFDISAPESPQLRKSTFIDFDIETLYPYKEYLLIGAANAMYIYDRSDPENLVRHSEYSHIRSCDPVVVQSDTAFVTLRSGTWCRGGQNELHILDISNTMKPEVLNTYPMANPHGLGVDGNLLFVADGYSGLKVFDISEPLTIDLIESIQIDNAYDIIADNGLLFVIAGNGLYQYDYSSLPLEFLSKIDIGG